MKPTLQIRVHWRVTVHRAALSIAAMILLGGCSLFAKEYRDETLSLSFEYPSGWNVIDEAAEEGTLSVTFQKDYSQWVLIALTELQTDENHRAHAEKWLADRIQERGELSNQNGGRLVDVKKDTTTCNSDCCSSHAQVVSSRLIELPPLHFIGKEPQERSTVADFAEDILVLSCKERASEVFAMRYADADPQKNRFVQSVLKTFRQVE